MANATVTVLEADGVTQTDVVVLDVGRQAAAASKSTAMSTEDKAVFDAINSNSSRLTSSATNIAPGSALATTSLLVGSRYNSTPPTFTNGQEGALQISSAGRLLTDASIATALPAGTNAIGKLAANAGVNVGEVSIIASQLANALTAYAAIAGAPAQQVAHPTDHPTMAVAQDTARILNGASGVSLTPKWATIAVSSSGENQIVAAVTSKKIRVLFWDLIPNAAVNAKWRSATTDSPGVWTDKTGLYYMAGQGNGQARGFNPVGWFETNSGEALSLNLSGAVATGGVVGYVEV